MHKLIITALLALALLPSCGSIIFVSDTSGPELVSHSPPTAATGVATDSLITATFDEQIDAATLTTATFHPDNGITGEVTYNAEKRQAVFTPAAPLPSATTITVTISSSVRDRQYNRFSGHVWSFTTQ